MKNKKWVKVMSILGIIVVVIAILIFLGFQKHTVEAKVISCTKKGIKTEQGTYRFVPNIGPEPYKILLRPEDEGGMFDSVPSNYLCDDTSFLERIKKIEVTGLGYITAFTISSVNSQ